MSFTDYEQSLINDMKSRTNSEETVFERQISANAAAVVNTSDKLDFFKLLIKAEDPYRAVDQVAKVSSTDFAEAGSREQDYVNKHIIRYLDLNSKTGRHNQVLKCKVCGKIEKSTITDLRKHI